MNGKTIVIIIVVAVILAGLLLWVNQPWQTGQFDEFAKCLGEKGTVFYGAFWCPHCQNQKKMFGKSAKYLPYVECSTPDGSSQLADCKNKNIESYPTWEFTDGSRLTGQISLAQLSEKTGCQLTQ